jgi:hypothetical protein
MKKFIKNEVKDENVSGENDIGINLALPTCDDRGTLKLIVKILRHKYWLGQIIDTQNILLPIEEKEQIWRTPLEDNLLRKPVYFELGTSITRLQAYRILGQYIIKSIQAVENVREGWECKYRNSAEDELPWLEETVYQSYEDSDCEGLDNCPANSAPHDAYAITSLAFYSDIEVRAFAFGGITRLEIPYIQIHECKDCFYIRISEKPFVIFDVDEYEGNAENCYHRLTEAEQRRLALIREDSDYVESLHTLEQVIAHFRQVLEAAYIEYADTSSLISAVAPVVGITTEDCTDNASNDPDWSDESQQEELPFEQE